MPQITRRLEFDAGHRVLGHQGRCRYVHGHRYVAEITVYAPDLDDLGMVIDFGKVKEVVGGWIDEHWDHNLILHPNDPLNHFHEETGRYSDLEIAERFLGRMPFVMPEELPNPTAENMAQFLFYRSGILLSEHGIAIAHVRLYETPNCYADCP